MEKQIYLSVKMNSLISAQCKITAQKPTSI